MIDLNSIEYQLLERLLKSSQEVLLSGVSEYLVSQYSEDRVVTTDKYIIAFGNEPIGLVAHLDTVHSVPVKDLFYDTQQGVMWSPQGIGADDRAGVYSILEIIGRGYRPTVILTTDEEIGAIGATALITDMPKLPAEMKFLVQLDRRGSLDCVFYDLDNIEFEEYIETFGFKTAIGSFSDISFLCPTWQIPGVNLSVGYYNEHSLHEYLNVNEMYATIEKVCNIIDDSDQADDFKWHTNSKYAIASWDTFNQPVADNEDICWGCMNFFNEAIMIKDGDCGYCGECYADLFKTCELCGDTFKKGLGENKYCKLCVDNY